jgi:biotin synthase
MLRSYSFSLRSGASLNKTRIMELINTTDRSEVQALFSYGRAVADSVFGRRVYMRGLIEFTNICKNNCYYCGIRKGNEKIERYRLTEEQILKCCTQGHQLGFRTFVL